MSIARGTGAIRNTKFITQPLQPSNTFVCHPAEQSPALIKDVQLMRYYRSVQSEILCMPVTVRYPNIEEQRSGNDIRPS